MAMGGLGQKSLADRATAIAAHHAGGEAWLVDEDEARDSKGWLFLAPDLTRGLDVGSVLFACVQGFF